MYNSRISVKKIQLLLNLFCFFDILFIPILISFKYLMDLIPNVVFKAEIPYHKTTDFYLLLDLWYFKINYLVYGISKNDTFIKERRERLNFIVAQAGRRNTKRNIEIRKQFKEYLKCVESRLYEDVLFNSSFTREVISSSEFDTADQSISVNSDGNYIITNKITRNAIIEYEFLRLDYNNRKIETSLTEETLKYLRKKYPSRFNNIKPSKYSDIILFILHPEKCNAVDGRLQNHINYNLQALEIAEYIGNQNENKRLSIRRKKLTELQE